MRRSRWHESWAAPVQLICIGLLVVACTTGPLATPAQPGSTPSPAASAAAATATPSPTADPTVAPTRTPVPTKPPNPLGLELRDRIAAFAPAVAKATKKVARRVPSNSISSLEAAEATLTAFRRLIGGETRWADSVDVDVRCSGDKCAVETSCELLVLWVDVVAGPSVGGSIVGPLDGDMVLDKATLYGDLRDRINESVGWRRQRQLDKALAELKSLNARVAKLAAAVKAAPDPCTVSVLP